MFDITNWVPRMIVASTEKMVLEGCLHMSGTQEELEISSVAGQPPCMVGDHISLPGLVIISPQLTEGFRPSSERPQHINLYRHLKCRLGC